MSLETEYLLVSNYSTYVAIKTLIFESDCLWCRYVLFNGFGKLGNLKSRHRCIVRNLRHLQGHRTNRYH
jgi:hypothetical protein